MEYEKPLESAQANRLAELFSVLANPMRLSIIRLLIYRSSMNREKGMCVAEINDLFDVPQPYVSKHLKVLHECGILAVRKEGNRRYYYLPEDSAMCTIFEFLGTCCDKYEMNPKRRT